LDEEKDYILQVKEYVSLNDSLPEVPYFEENIENVFSEHYQKVNDPERLLL
jgi:hypothetical protein